MQLLLNYVKNILQNKNDKKLKIKINKKKIIQIRSFIY